MSSPGISCSAPPASACSTARRELLEAMPPYQGGGDMIESVTFEKTHVRGLPNKFEAGTPDIAGAVGLGAAIDYVDSSASGVRCLRGDALLTYATERLARIPGPAADRDRRQEGGPSLVRARRPAGLVA